MQNRAKPSPWSALLAMSIAGLAVSLASAQTKITGDGACPKGQPPLKMDVGDRPGHSMSLNKSSCAWNRAFDMAGLKAKTYVGVGVSDSQADKSKYSGYVVITMDNGDKAFVSSSGTSTIAKDGSSISEGTWSYTGGTGKLRGLTGKGTFKSTGAADGSSTDHIDGDYAVPATKGKK